MVALRKQEIAETGFEPPRDEIASHHLIDETRLVGGLIERAVYTEEERRRTADIARRLVHAARASDANHSGVDAFMREYGLSSDEGVILMCLAEALLRIPDAETADKFIAEKIAGGHWERHLGHSESMFVNASTWGLMLTGRIVKLRETRGHNPWDALKRLVARSGEPVIRQAMRQAVRLLGDQFVLGRSIKEAIARAASLRGARLPLLLRHARRGGENREGCRALFRALHGGDRCRRRRRRPDPPTPHADALMARPGLVGEALGAASALRARQGKAPRGRAGAAAPHAAARRRGARARHHHRRRGAGPARADARLVRAGLHASRRSRTGPAWASPCRPTASAPFPSSAGCGGFRSAAASAFPSASSRAPTGTARSSWAQERGLADYPVLTRKLHTDVSYLACMRLLLSDPGAFYAQFATHNAHTVASAFVAAGQTDFEFQRLHGMGEALYEEVSGRRQPSAALPHLCARRRARGSALLSRAPPARERRQHLVRQSPRRRRGAGRPDHPRSRRDGRARAHGAAPVQAPAAAARHLLAGAQELVRRCADGRRPRAARCVRRWSGADAPASMSGPIVDGEATVGRTQAPANVVCPHDRRERIGTVAHRDAGASRSGDRERGRTPPMAGTGSAARRGRRSSTRRRHGRARPREAHGGARARRRQDACPPRWPKCARPPICCATTPSRRAA